MGRAQGVDRLNDRLLDIGHHPRFLQVDPQRCQKIGDIAEILVLGTPGQDLIADQQDGGGRCLAHVAMVARLDQRAQHIEELVGKKRLADHRLIAEPSPSTRSS